MTDSNPISRLRVGLHPALTQSLPEIKYVLRTLLRLAGFASEFIMTGGNPGTDDLDICYGPPNPGAAALVDIHWCGLKFCDTPQLEPSRLIEQDGIAYLDFGTGGGCDRPAAGRLRFTNDIIFSSYWLLIGAREPAYRRDRLDNLHLDGSFFLKHGLASRPLVSEYAALLREHFTAQGRTALALPWSGRSAAFAFTHDVDYPQIIRSIESARLLVSRGVKALPSIPGILKGTNHFWKFAQWVEFESALGTRPTFYFMARKGSLAQYATGTPDCFYDIRKPEFTSLFRELREQGCEIGLHASYNAHRSAHQLRHEKESLEQAAGVKVEGNRHHYWHLDPAAPHETLRRQEQAGLVYDSSLGFEFYPGFRRGVCHPFRPYHPQERRELSLVELPPTWMDDHFDRRLAVNGIADPTDFARTLVHTASKLGGTIVVDYHLRGMNADFYPRYGEWLRQFVRQELDSRLSFQTAGEIARQYIAYEERLNAASLDQTAGRAAHRSSDRAQGDGKPGARPPRIAPSTFEVRAIRLEDIPGVAQLHYQIFGTDDATGLSAAKLGPDFLAEVFYRPNLDNAQFFCDVAIFEGHLAGFSAYSSCHQKVFRHLLRRHVLRTARGVLRSLKSHPRSWLTALSNASYLRGEHLPFLAETDGWWIVAGVRPEYRSAEFKKQTGLQVASEMFDRMEHVLKESNCRGWYGAVRSDNTAINRFLQRRGAKPVGIARTQGLALQYYVATLDRPFVSAAGQIEIPSPAMRGNARAEEKQSV